MPVQGERGSSQVGWPAASSGILNFLQTCTPPGVLAVFDLGSGDAVPSPGGGRDLEVFLAFIFLMISCGISGSELAVMVAEQGEKAGILCLFVCFPISKVRPDENRMRAFADLPAYTCINDNPYYDQYYYFYTLFQSGYYMQAVC